MELSVFFAGTAGSVPSARRGLPALLVRHGAERILFDCGEGTQRQLVRSVGLADLTDIFITHLHADHWLGLPGMLKSFDLRDRDRPLTVFGPPGLGDLMDVMRRQVFGRLGYELTIVELEPGEAIRRDELQIHAVRRPPPRHRLRLRPRRGRPARSLRRRARRPPRRPPRAPTSGASSAGRRSAASTPSR